MTRKQLLKSREYWIAQVQLNLFNLIEDYRKKKNLNKTQLAKELGVTKGYITQILNGDFDHKVSKLIDLSLAFNKAPIFNYVDLDKYIQNDTEARPQSFTNRHQRPIEVNTFIYLNTGKKDDIVPDHFYKTKAEIVESASTYTGKVEVFEFSPITNA